MIIALVLFFIVKAYEPMQRAMEGTAVEEIAPTVEEKLNETLTRLTDYLKSRPR